jgi:hypothetical protein
MQSIHEFLSNELYDGVTSVGFSSTVMDDIIKHWKKVVQSKNPDQFASKLAALSCTQSSLVFFSWNTPVHTQLTKHEVIVSLLLDI